MSKLFTVGADRKLVERTPNGLGASMPVGSLMMFAGSTPPESWMICDGSEISRTTFAQLFSVIGVTYGPGNGSTTFNLPDLRDRFVQGAAVAGDVREAGLPNIEGRITNCYMLGSAGGQATGAFGTTVGGPTDNFSRTAPIQTYLYGQHSFSAQNSNPIYGASPTVQPPAITAIPCIKAFGSVVNDLGVSLSDLVVRSTIIYPNGGSEGAEANVVTNNSYQLDNPFSGYFVRCEAQILSNGKWGAPCWFTERGTDGVTKAWGVLANQVLPEDKIVVQVGKSGIATSSNISGNPFTTLPVIETPTPCRVIVTRLGKM